MNEQEAIQRLKRGDIRGLETLIYSYQVKAVCTAYLITHDLHVAEEVVQDSFIQVYHAIRSFGTARLKFLGFPTGFNDSFGSDRTFPCTQPFCLLETI